MSRLISSTEWVPLGADDISEVYRIANIVHPDLPERLEVFAEKFRLFPQGCLKFVDESRMWGYGIAHPWNIFPIPDLDTLTISYPDDADCMYIHDVAVLPEARGNHAAERYVAIMRKLSQELSLARLACVSVYGTDVLWSRFGFETVASVEISQQLKKYGPTAKYMIASSKVS